MDKLLPDASYIEEIWNLLTYIGLIEYGRIFFIYYPSRLS